MGDFPGAATLAPGALRLAVDWPAPALWPHLERGARVSSLGGKIGAAKLARTSAYALARLAGWRDDAHVFAGVAPVTVEAVFLPNRPRDFDAPGALAALDPVLEAIADILHIDRRRLVVDIRVDPAPRWGIVALTVTAPGAAP
jgi:hypothetical protein